MRQPSRFEGKMRSRRCINNMVVYLYCFVPPQSAHSDFLDPHIQNFQDFFVFLTFSNDEPMDCSSIFRSAVLD
jgi:hypothetical protein